MAWSSIIGQTRVKTILQRAIIEKRVAHAYCFWGADGIGKDAIALEFAKVLNCSAPQHSDSSIAACDTCRSCTQASHLSHPNIQLVFALPAGKSEESKSSSPLLKLSDDQIKIVQEQIRMKADNPYHAFSIPNARHIRIAAVRELKKHVSLSAPQHGRRVIVISRAETMNTEAANAFLKTLEEPTGHVTFILTTSRRDRVLPTILSRCQQVQCSALSDTDISTALSDRLEIEESDARLVARLAGGSYARACELVNEDIRNARHDVVDFFRAILKQRKYILHLHHHIETIAASKDRTRVEQMLTLLMLWLRDAYTFAMAGNTASVINIDQVNDIQSFVKNFASADLVEATRKIEESIEMVRHNVQLSLVLTRLALELRGVFLRRPVLR